MKNNLVVKIYIMLIMFLILMFSINLKGEKFIEKTVNHTFNVKNNGILKFDVINAKVSVISGLENKVRVKITKKNPASDKHLINDFFKGYNVKYSKQNNTVSIYTDQKNEDKIDLKYIIIVPKNFNLNIKSFKNIFAEKINGRVRCDTSKGKGNISFKNINGEILGKTSDGTINSENCSGEAYFTTISGSCYIKKYYGELIINSNGGKVYFSKIYGPMKAEIDGGHVQYDVKDQQENNCILNIKKGGNVNVNISWEINLKVHFKSYKGLVYFEIPARITGKFNKKEIDATYNRGGKLLSIENFSGDIIVKRFKKK